MIKRHGVTFRQKSDSPIFEAMTRAIVEFSKAGVMPSKLQKLTIAAEVFDALYLEGKHGGEYLDEPRWISIAGVVIHRGV